MSLGVQLMVWAKHLLWQRCCYWSVPWLVPSGHVALRLRDSASCKLHTDPCLAKPHFFPTEVCGNDAETHSFQILLASSGSGPTIGPQETMHWKIVEMQS